jgi:predicted nucleotide-binding protein
MKKHRVFRNTIFSGKAIAEADQAIESILTKEDRKYLVTEFLAQKDADEDWEFDSLEEFLAAFQGHGNYTKRGGPRGLSFYSFSDNTTVNIHAPTRSEIDAVANVFEKHAPSCMLPIVSATREVRVYIGHGRSPLWRDLKDHLQDKHNYDVEAYDIGARAGHAIRDILGEMLRKSSIAFLVMTGEDETADGKLLARQNVIHEVGLFQGRLGFNRAIVLLEEGTEEFSNIAGIQQIRFPKGRIKETFGDILAVISREFG